MTTDQLLVLDGLRVTIGGRAVVTGLDLAVRAGRITALVGESGSGKSMTALATIGLQPRVAEVSGSALLDGEQLVGRPAQEMRPIRYGRVGMVFQEPSQTQSPVR
jgi:ABC-type glutathione transport system ATPase component